MLSERSKQIRRDTIVLSKANGGYHYGGCFSCIEILISIYDYILTVNDKFILSKGHACWPYYVILREKGFDPCLEGHPCRDVNNGIHCTTGSLGHGFPISTGIAIAKKLKKDNGNVYVLMGDGEFQEGTTWESLLIASKNKLSNLFVIVDFNKIQGSGFISEILPLYIDNISVICSSLGWNCSIVDGHDIDSIVNSLKVHTGHPKLVIANTVKGKGISFMENKPEWHAKWLDHLSEKEALEELM